MSATIPLDAPIGRVPDVRQGSSLVLRVSDIRCAACVSKIERGLGELEGIQRCRTNLPTKTLVIEYHGISSDEVVSYIRELGFHGVEVDGASEKNALILESRAMLSRLGVAGIGMMQVMMFALAGYLAGDGGIEPAYQQLMHWASLAIAIPVTFYSAATFHQGAYRDLKRLSLGMDVPVSLAILAAFWFSTYNVLNQQPEVYFDSLCMFTFLLLIGRFVELSSRRRYQDGVTLAEHCLPTHATMADGGRQSVSELVSGDRLKVIAGEVIPGDGIVLRGISSVSEMAFTGESMPLTKRPGSRVLAGSTNLDGELVIEVSVSFDEFVIRKMSDLYREAILYKPQFSILADKIARYFVMCILLLAAGSGLLWYLAGEADWFAIALTVLVVSCPCALSLATPVAYTVAISALKRFGIVVGTGEFIERLNDITHVVFDKTGTLTEGKLIVNQVRPTTGLYSINESEPIRRMSRSEILEICTALERPSVHPIARAFDTGAKLTLSDSEVVVGSGVQGVVDGTMYRLGKPDFACSLAVERPTGAGLWILLASDQPIAWINLLDEIRPEAKALVDRLKQDFAVSLLSGDTEQETNRVAKLIGIEAIRADVTPQMKLEEVTQLQASGSRVLMVGDGVNDAAAMGAAHASVAVNPVDILVQEAAQATLVQNDINRLSALLIFSKKVKGIIRQNIFWAVGYNLCVIPLAVSGVLMPWMAALGMSLSSLLVVLNANRLGEVKE